MHKALLLGFVTSDIHELLDELEEMGLEKRESESKIKKKERLPTGQLGERRKENCLSLAVQSSVVGDQEFLPCISSRVVHFHLALPQGPHLMLALKML